MFSIDKMTQAAAALLKRDGSNWNEAEQGDCDTGAKLKVSLEDCSTRFGNSITSNRWKVVALRTFLIWIVLKLVKTFTFFQMGLKYVCLGTRPHVSFEHLTFWMFEHVHL